MTSWRFLPHEMLSLRNRDIRLTPCYFFPLRYIILMRIPHLKPQIYSIASLKHCSSPSYWTKFFDKNDEKMTDPKFIQYYSRKVPGASEHQKTWKTINSNEETNWKLKNSKINIVNTHYFEKKVLNRNRRDSPCPQILMWPRGFCHQLAWV